MNEFSMSPLYERTMPKLPFANESHKVPSGYWKIITLKKGPSLEIAAFIFDQDTPKNDEIMKHHVTIDEIERRSKLDFFWELNDTLEDSLEKNENLSFANKYFKD